MASSSADIKTVLDAQEVFFGGGGLRGRGNAVKEREEEAGEGGELVEHDADLTTREEAGEKK